MQKQDSRSPRDATSETKRLKNETDSRSAVMGWLQAFLPPAIICGSLAAYFLWGHRPPVPAREATEAFVPTVTAATASTFDGTIEIAVEGIVKPFRHVSVAAEVAGRIRLKTPVCEEATFVRRGDLLLEIDPTDYEIAVRRFSQELKQTESALHELDVERDNTHALIALAEEDEQLTTRELDRLRKLASSGGSSQSAVDTAQRAQLIARNNLLTLQNQIRLIEARYTRAQSAHELQRVELERAERDLKRTKILAPCDGTIVTESVEQDAYAQPGTTLVIVNDTSAAEVVCQLEIDDMYWLWGTKDPNGLLKPQDPSAYDFPRWPVQVEFPLQDMICQWQGEMIRYGGTGMNLATRTVPCQVHVSQPLQGSLCYVHDAASATVDPSELKDIAEITPESNERSGVVGLVPPPLTVGMFVTVRAQVKPHANLIAMPADGLRAGPSAWVIREGRLHVAPVKVARRLKNEVLVYNLPEKASGLLVGDRVITSPLAASPEGMAVREVDGP